MTILGPICFKVDTSTLVLYLLRSRKPQYVSLYPKHNLVLYQLYWSMKYSTVAGKLVFIWMDVFLIYSSLKLSTQTGSRSQQGYPVSQAAIWMPLDMLLFATESSVAVTCFMYLWTVCCDISGNATWVVPPIDCESRNAGNGKIN